ncbi:hypothetical protein L484_027869 [Morus notabilis]|uniref:Uncharacterized protein n=1 Tax=Morus notabilis TaxID=981085 RepID=W9SHU4_9ROSA|nr:hypothetical protein L484_027869 [Morus notabilis]
MRVYRRKDGGENENEKRNRPLPNMERAYKPSPKLGPEDGKCRACERRAWPRHRDWKQRSTTDKAREREREREQSRIERNLSV